MGPGTPGRARVFRVGCRAKLSRAAERAVVLPPGQASVLGATGPGPGHRVRAPGLSSGEEGGGPRQRHLGRRTEATTCGAAHGRGAARRNHTRTSDAGTVARRVWPGRHCAGDSVSGASRAGFNGESAVRERLRALAAPVCRAVEPREPCVRGAGAPGPATAGGGRRKAAGGPRMRTSDDGRSGSEPLPSCGWPTRVGPTPREGDCRWQGWGNAPARPARGP
jgi:hypothetical protein